MYKPVTLMNDLIRDEGMRLKPYHDIMGKLTVGVGRNLDDVGITEEEALYLLNNDIDRARRDLFRECPWWEKMPEPAQRGLLNMCFNLGWPRLSSFVRMLDALEHSDYMRAASEALNSKWARQVGGRAHRVANLYRKSA